MNLGFYYHIPAIQENGIIQMPGYLGRFLDELAKHVELLVLFLHLPNEGENAHFDYALTHPNIRLVSLPPRGSAWGRLVRWRSFKKMILQNKAELDLILVRAPSPLAPWVAGLWPPNRRVFLLVGDYVEGVASLPQPRWRKELIRLFAWWNESEQLSAMRQALVFANSKPLLQKHTPRITKLFETRTTTLSEGDLFLREDTCLGQPIHLLYAGRLDPAKGLMDIANGVISLAKEGYDLIFEVVGWVDNDSGILEQLQNRFNDAGMPERFKYLGYKAIGEDLFACYRQADIFVIASRNSEGFPRAIWEAMAHGLPVVATDVGSIREFTSGAIYLTKPRNVVAFVDSLRLVVSDHQLRRLKIQSGYKIVRLVTLEIQVKEMSDRIKIELSVL